VTFEARLSASLECGGPAPLYSRA